MATLAVLMLPTLTASATTNSQFGLWIGDDAGPGHLFQTSTNLLFWSTISTSTLSVFSFYWVNTNFVTAPFRFYRTKPGA